MPPEYTGAMFNLPTKYNPRTPDMDPDLGSNFSNRDAYTGNGSDQALLKKYLRHVKESRINWREFNDDSTVGPLNLDFLL